MENTYRNYADYDGFPDTEYPSMDEPVEMNPIRTTRPKTSKQVAISGMMPFLLLVGGGAAVYFAVKWIRKKKPSLPNLPSMPNAPSMPNVSEKIKENIMIPTPSNIVKQTDYMTDGAFRPSNIADSVQKAATGDVIGALEGPNLATMSASMAKKAITGETVAPNVTTLASK